MRNILPKGATKFVHARRRKNTPETETGPVKRVQDNPVTAAEGPLFVNDEGTWAVYVVDTIDDMNRPTDKRAEWRRTSATRWADLAGHAVRLQIVPTPYPSDVLERDLVAKYPNALGRTPVDRSWEERAAHAAALADSYKSHRPLPLLYVRLAQRQFTKAELASILSPTPIGERTDPLEQARTIYTTVTSKVAREPWRAWPAAQGLIMWTALVTAGMGAPAPAVMPESIAGFDTDTMPDFAGLVDYHTRPLAPTTTVTCVRRGTTYENHVRVLRVEWFDERGEDNGIDDGGVDERLPSLGWLATWEGGITHVIAQGRIRAGSELTSKAEFDTVRTKDHVDHAEAHGATPVRVRDAAIRAEEIEHEIASRHPEIANRFEGIILVAVTADTAEEAVKKAASLADDAKREQGLTLTPYLHQEADYLAFRPGYTPPFTGGITRQNCAMFANTGFNASPRAGDRHGYMVGPIMGSTDMFVFDPIRGTYRQAGFVPVIGGLGSGKSFLEGSVSEWLYASGTRITNVDASNAWARLADLGANHIPVTEAGRGAMMPTLLVRDPNAVSDPELRDQMKLAAAKASAVAERKALVIDNLQGQLPTDGLSYSARKALSLAVEKVGGQYGTSTYAYTSALRAQGSEGADLADYLESRADLPGGSLIFPPTKTADVDPDKARSILDHDQWNILTMGGLNLPAANSDPASWDERQRMSVQVLALTARFAIMPMYDRMDEPYAAVLDEFDLMLEGAATSMAASTFRAVMDSRKYLGLIMPSVKQPSTLRKIHPNIGNQISVGFVGRCEDENTAREALEVLSIRDQPWLVNDITGQQTGEFFVKHPLRMIQPDGKPVFEPSVRQVYHDASWLPPAVVSALTDNADPAQMGAATLLDRPVPVQ